jgi:hypothetical protein
VEHDPEQLWRAQLACARQALAKARIRAGDITAIGVTNQRETTIVWERATGRPIHNGIVWQDRRTAAACERLRSEGWSERARKDGLGRSYFSAPNRLDPGQRPDADPRRARGTAFGTDTWLTWKLSGGALHITDASNASRTLLYDIHADRWDEELLALFGVPAALLPGVRASSEVYGHCLGSVLGAAIPIAGIAGDQQAALFGQACHAPGMAKNTYGTGCFLLLNTGERAFSSREGLLTTAAARIGRTARPQYALEGSVFIGGAVVQWLRDGLELITSGDVETLAASGRTPRGHLSGVRGPRRTALGRLRARRNGGSHARHDRRPPRARRARVDRVPVGRGARSHAARFGRAARRAARRRRRRRERPAHAVPGGPARRAGGARACSKRRRWHAPRGRGRHPRNRDAIAGQWQKERVFDPGMSRDEAAARWPRGPGRWKGERLGSGAASAEGPLRPQTGTNTSAAGVSVPERHRVPQPARADAGHHPEAHPARGSSGRSVTGVRGAVSFRARRMRLRPGPADAASW